MEKDNETLSGGQNRIPNNVISDTLTDKCIEERFEDDGEDLPDNFFDDFSNQDFMEGLNVVDDWHDDDETNEFSDERRVRVEKNSSRQREERPERGRREYRYESSYRRKEEDRRRSHSRYRRSYSRNRRSCSRNRRSRSRNRRSHSRNHQRQVSNRYRSEEREISDDRRRDPEKTKRDIQRDKLRCAKDHEARVFQEQLKIAETGLVPPGTELDVVLSSEKFKPEEESLKKETTVKKFKSEEKKVKPVVIEKKKEESLHRKLSPIHRSRHRLLRHSPSRERSYSPKRRKRTPHSRDRFRDIPDIDLRYRIREKRERYMSDRSPLSHRRTTKSPSPYNSPVSGTSERESWLRGSERYSSIRRSLSPVNTSRIRDGSPKRKKYSFMEEIEIKLRQNKPVGDPNLFNIQPNIPQLMNVPVPKPDFFSPQLPFQPNPQLYMDPHPNMCPPPSMCPAPSMCPPPERFQQPIILSGDPNMIPQMFIPNAPMFPRGLPQYNVPRPVPAPPIYVDHNRTPLIQNFEANNTPTIGTGVQQENKDLTKLFEDKKISLSDFLSVSAKPLDPSSPVDIHNKIKVISRCQEAIKLLENPMLVGRFIPRISQQTLEAEKRAVDSAKSACVSPLRKAIIIRFNFTVPISKRSTNKSSEQHSYRTTLHKIMCLVGLPDQQNILSPVSQESPKDQETPEIITPLAPETKRILNPKPKTHTVSIQTNPVICNICEIRSARKFSDNQTQTVEKSSCTVSTQVNIEDLTKSCTTFIPRGILKSSTTSCQSISHLTPAQLLSQLQTEKKEDSNLSGMKKETFPAYGRSYSDFSNANRNSYSDKFMGSDNNTNIYGVNKPTGIKYLPDRFVGNMGNVGFNNMGRSDQFSGQSSLNSRGFMTSFTSRQFQDSGPGLNWSNAGIGRGSINPINNQTGFGNMQNKFFNQRGPN